MLGRITMSLLSVVINDDERKAKWQREKESKIIIFKCYFHGFQLFKRFPFKPLSFVPLLHSFTQHTTFLPYQHRIVVGITTFLFLFHKTR